MTIPKNGPDRDGSFDFLNSLSGPEKTDHTPRKKEDPAVVSRRLFAEWLAEGVRYEIDFSIGEDGVAIVIPIGERPSMIQWLDEWVGEFFSASGWLRYEDIVEDECGEEFVEVIRRDETEEPSPQELEAAMEKVQADRELTERLKAEAGVVYDSSLHQCSDSDREVVYENPLGLTEDDNQAYATIPKWEQNLFWASRIDRNKLYDAPHAIFHGQDLIKMLERWAREEYAEVNEQSPRPAS